MRHLLRKLMVITVAILTFGTVTPSHALWQELGKGEHRGQAAGDTPYRETLDPELIVEEELGKDEFVSMVMSEAERQSLIKFGSKITPVIEDEFKKIILPNIEQALHMTALQYPDEELGQLSITESPGGGVSEKIFHIYHSKTNKDIIRFHVRRDKPPLEGYMFNFHYHTHHDNFQTHHSLGSIQWDKNTPPNWKSS
ncbi:MAG TPA: YpjP family protein [Bacillaceae bacterium]